MWTNYAYKAPLACSALACILGNLFYCLSFDLKSLPLLLLARLVTGVGASQPGGPASCTWLPAAVLMFGPLMQAQRVRSTGAMCEPSAPVHLLCHTKPAQSLPCSAARAELVCSAASKTGACPCCHAQDTVASKNENNSSRRLHWAGPCLWQRRTGPGPAACLSASAQWAWPRGPSLPCPCPSCPTSSCLVRLCTVHAHVVTASLPCIAVLRPGVEEGVAEHSQPGWQLQTAQQA